MAVAVVTDSTSDLPTAVAASWGVRVVPLTVTFGAADVVSRATLDVEEFYRRLATDESPPTTSQPSAPAFESVWAAAASEGADAIVSLHASGRLSSTVDRARAAAAAAPVPVEVVDSHQVSCGLVLQVLAAAAVAAAGGDVPAVVAAAARVAERTTSVLALDSLDHLRRGGRLAGGHAAVTSGLRSKPVLVVRGGRIEPLDRARTWRRAIDRLVDEVVAAADDAPQRVVVGHALDEQRAATLLAAARLRVEVAAHDEVVFGPVVGTHTGPGAVGLAAVPADLVGLHVPG